MKKIVNIILLISFWASAQEYKGDLQRVNSNGLHQILLSTEVIAAANNTISSLRIYDANNVEIPFALYESNLSESNRVNFPIAEKRVIDTVSTSIIVLNENNKKLDGLYLKIANTNVSKIYNIYGSNDQKEWFGLVTNQSAINLSTEHGIWVERLFQFPVNNYKFIKFEFLDKKSLPINILEVNFYTNQKNDKKFTSLNNFSQTKSLNKATKQTEFVFTFDKPQLINQIEFDVSAPNYYLRNAEIIIEKTKKRKKRDITYLERYTSFELNSKSTNQFNIGSLFTNSFTLIIDNKDNPELTINAISLLQNLTYLIADLKANENYTLVINPAFKKPSYDIARIEIDFDKNYPTTQVLSISEVTMQTNDADIKSFWQTSTFMWICIVIAIVVLGSFSISMIKDLGKEK